MFLLGKGFYYKIIYLFILIVIFIFINSKVSLATTFSYSGFFNLGFTSRNLNESYIAIPSNPNNNSNTLGGDLFIKGVDEEHSLLQSFVDISFTGSFQNTQNYTPNISQCYIIFPMSDNVFIFLGKKLKQIGVTNFFNVTNRIVYAPIIESDIIYTDSLSNGFIINYKDTQNGEQPQYSSFLDYQYKNFNLQAYYYHERDQKNYLGLDLTYQHDIYQLYFESIIKNKTEQLILTNSPVGDPSKDFISQKQQNVVNFIMGGKIETKNYSLNIECLFNNEGLDQDQQNSFLDYVQSIPINQRSSFLATYWPYIKNYVGVNLTMPMSFISNDLSLSISSIGALQLMASSQDFNSYHSTISLNYNVYQNLGLYFSVILNTGGAKGIYTNLYEDNSYYILGINYTM